MDDGFTDAFGAEGDEHEDDVRYGLTALGASHLEERRSFVGFGPCAAMRPSEANASSPVTARRTIGPARARRATSLFGS